MKKSLIALAALAAVTAASAQSTVTISGAYAFSYQKDLTNTTANGTLLTVNSATGAASAAAADSTVDAKGLANTSAEIKLAGVEDLGGGLKASFDMTWESGNFRGAPITRADSGMAVSGGFGTIAIRQTRSGDQLGDIASSAISLPDGYYESITTRPAVDMVQFTAPAISGLTASVAYVEGNDGGISVPTTNAKSVNVLGVGYTNGPVSAGYALKSHALNSGSTVKKNQSEFKVSYNAGFATVAYGWDDKTTTDSTAKAASGFAVTAPMGAITLGAHRFTRGDVKMTEFGAKYDLSKRTAITVAQGTMKGLATGKNGTQSRIRLAHSF
ncbi:MAG: porin [Rhodoferax sp.]|nr:porin [Rhodoferax sp.]